MRREARRRLRAAARTAEAATPPTTPCPSHPGRLHKHQAAPYAAPAPLPVGSARRGLVARLRAVLVRRHLTGALSSPALVPLVAVAVVAVFAAVAVGAIIGAALATRHGGGDWS